MATLSTVIWWLAAAVMVLPFADLVQRTLVGSQQWLTRATAARSALAVAEGATLLAWWLLRGPRFTPEPVAAVAFIGAVLALTGAALAAWAKLKLGRLFSPQLGIQRDHTLVTSGPYALVRHPIYLGIIDFLAGTALYLNDVVLLLAAALFGLWFGLQLRIEERMFSQHFGAQWDAYRRRTPALFPGLRPRP